MRHLFVTSVLSLFVITLFSQCSSKSSDPAPASTLDYTSDPYATYSSNCILNGTAYSLTSKSTVEPAAAGSPKRYVLGATNGGSVYPVVVVAFQSKPAAGVYTVASYTDAKHVVLGYQYSSNTSDVWAAISGTVTVTANGSERTATFSNVTFYDSSSATQISSGSVSGS